jgi:hypothetical protein
MVRAPTRPPLDDLRPVRAHRWTTGEEDRVTVVIPKFTNRWLVRWFVPLLAKPEVRLRLDAMGSFVWRQCDGSLTVREIADRVRERFGGDPEPTLDSVVQFMRRLTRADTLTFIPPGADPVSVGEGGATPEEPS